MFQSLWLVISYGSLLILLIPSTGLGFISAAVMLALGIAWMVYKKVLKVAFWKHRSYPLLGCTVFAATVAGIAFYKQMLISYKMNVLAAMLHMSVETILLPSCLVLSVLSTYFIYTALQAIARTLSGADRQNNFAGTLIASALASVITVMLSQVMIGTKIISMDVVNLLFGSLIVLAVISFLYGLLGRIVASIAIGSGIFMLISTINAYVFSFRGRLFEPVDIFSAGTAMNVAESYPLLPLPSGLAAGWLLFAAMVFVLACLYHKAEPRLFIRRRAVTLAVCVIASAAAFFYASNLKTYHWEKEGAQNNGYILDFVSKFKEIAAPEPDNYHSEQIDALADQYAAAQTEDDSAASKRPHIIVIMDEAFSDLTVAGTFATNTEVAPFISSLKENTISGYTLSSVYGGNTANSEYEFLTGNSMAWLSPNAVPYQQYLRSSTYSMVSYLKSTYDYKCIAMHPYLSSGWNRPAAYECLGFDEMHFIEDFPQENRIRNYVSDQEMFEVLTETYEAQKETPLFLFGVTMQNHGGYTYTGDDYTQHISLPDYGDRFPDVEQYLSLIHETDKAVEYLITYFQNVDEDVVIVFFGDHQPKIDDSFYETISGTAADTLDEQQKRYTIPFFIWANYDIEEKYIDCTSLNYLSSYVYDAAGLALPPYNRFLQAMEDVIPAINANGFYSPASGCFLPFEEANEAEQQWLWTYEALQYNSIFDKAHQNKILFPALS